jgi:hypothetical protein
MKLIEWQDGRLECYDLKNDYGEQHDLMGSPAVATQVDRLREGLLSELGPFPVQEAPTPEDAHTPAGTIT